MSYWTPEWLAQQIFLNYLMAGVAIFLVLVVALAIIKYTWFNK